MSDGDVIFRVLLKGELLRVEVTEVVKVFTKNGTVEAYNLDGTFYNAPKNPNNFSTIHL